MHGRSGTDDVASFKQLAEDGSGNPFVYPKALRAHVLRRLSPKTILYRVFELV